MPSFKTTKDIEVPKRVVDQVIGQDFAVEVIKKAAEQRRHVLLIGEPGTGKSMLGVALADLLTSHHEQEDVLCYPNEKDPNQPLIKTFKAEEGEKIIVKLRNIMQSGISARRFLLFIIFGIVILGLIFMFWQYKESEFAPFVILGGVFNMIWIIFMLSFLMRGAPGMFKTVTGLAMMPKPLVTHKKNEKAPFVDATGAHDGALLGDVLHDPFQSGGLGTPPHERVIPGMIHKANNGVLFLDEVATLSPRSQQELLTALQEGKYSITGQSEKSAGSMVRTEAVPCKFILVAAGNMMEIQHMHPALRSRIRGYGYEVHMKETMPDSKENRQKIARFVAQEIKKDGKIPAFDKKAVETIIHEARKMANRKDHLTLRLREVGGLIRAAGDLAKEQKAKTVTPKHVLEARKIAKTLEQQIADKYIARKKEYEVIVTKGKQVGRVNGLAVMGSDGAYSGIILPIESAVTPGGKEREIVATGKLGDIAKEAIKNVSAIIKKHFGQDIKETHDVYVQFLQTYEGVEGDSASVAVATTIISALKGIPIKQDYAMTGSLSVRGEVLPIGGVSAKIDAAIDAGIKNVIVPESNMKDIVIDEDRMKKIKIIPVKTITEVLKSALEWKGKENILKKINSKL